MSLNTIRFFNLEDQIASQSIDLDSFLMVIDTTQAGSASDTIILEFHSGYTYDYLIDWGDNSSETVTDSNDLTHVYDSSGTYLIRITAASGGADWGGLNFNNGGDKEKLIDIRQWGNLQWKNLSNSFYGCDNLDISASDAPDLTITITSLSSAWRDSAITKLPLLHPTNNSSFLGICRANSNLTTINEAQSFEKATALGVAFQNCTSLVNLPRYIYAPNVGTVEFAFQNIPATGEITIEFANLTYAGGCFRSSGFSKVTVLGDWGTSTNASSFCYDMENLTEFKCPGGFDNITILTNFFGGCDNLTNEPSCFVTGPTVTRLDYLYSGSGLTTIDLNNYDLTNIDRVTGFLSNTDVTSVDFTPWAGKGANCLTWKKFLDNATALTSITGLKDLDFSAAEDMEDMFNGTNLSGTFDMSGVDLSSVKNMQELLSGNENITVINLSSITWGGTLQNLNRFANGCSGLAQIIGVGDIDITGLTDANNILNNTTINTTGSGGYDELLTGWEAQSYPVGSILLGAGNAQYSAAPSAAATARANLIADGWIITDGGPV